MSESNEPSLAAIFELVKDLSEKNNKTNNLVDKLSLRLDSIESSPKRKGTSQKQKGGPFKRSKPDVNNNAEPAESLTSITKNQICSVQGSKQSVPSRSGSLAKSLGFTNTCAKQPAPLIREPLAKPCGASSRVVSDSAHSTLVLDAVITDDYTDLELEGDNVALEDLERMFLENEDESDNSATARNEASTDTEKSVVSTKESNLPIISNETNGNWHISEDTLQWYQTVADLELDEEQILNLEELYSSSDNIAEEFVPPKVPSVFWNKIRHNNVELYKHKSVMKSQKLTTLAVKPLLSVLDKMDRNDPNVSMIASSIQLICSANLQLSRLRRASTVKFMKNDFKSELFSLPVTHRDLFGTDFEAAADQAIKAQNSSQKVLFHPKPQKQPDSVNHDYRPSMPGPSTSTSTPNQRDRNQPFRQRRGRNFGRSRLPYSKRR